MNAMTKLRGLAGILVLAGGVLAAPAQAGTTIVVSEDVMASPFFTAYGSAANPVRGYGEESNREVLRVSSASPFGLTGAEVIYLSFDYDFSVFSGPVRATLNMHSVSGGFGADASAESPFLVSVHALAADPLSTIIDDTNPGGTVNWLDFQNGYLLPAASAASTLVSAFGLVSFDVSAAVNEWISGSSTVFALAVSGLNDTSGSDFLHGFLNNNNGGVSQGHTFLSISPVSEPQTYAMMLAGLGLMGAIVRRRRRGG